MNIGNEKVKESSVEIFDSKTGESFQLIFDDMSKEQIAKAMVDCLINGVPRERIVREIPDFLKRG